MRLASRRSIIVSCASLARREKCNILWGLRVSQFLKSVLILASLATKFLFARLIRSESRYYEICQRDSQEASLTTKFLSARLVRSESRYEISVCETCKKRVLVLILTRESRENFVPKKRFSLLANISKSDSRVNSSRKPVRKHADATWVKNTKGAQEKEKNCGRTK
jgi:hypothetical protein